MKDQLTARYQNYSISELLEVLENKAEYTPVAIEVAESEWDNRRITGFTAALYFLPFIFLPGTIYYFYKRSPVGWTMLSIWLTYIFLSAVYACLYDLALPVTFEFNDDSGIMGLLNEVSPGRGLSHYFLSLLIFGGVLYYINTTPVKQLFSLNKWLPIASIGLTALVVTVQWIPLLF